MTHDDSGTRAVDRRAFLRASAFAIAAMPLGACVARRGEPPAASLFPGGADLVAGRAQRFTFALVDADGRPILEPAQVRVASGDEPGIVLTSAWRDYAAAGGLDAPAGYHVVELPPLPAGFADLEATAGGARGAATIDVLERPLAPDVGDRPPAVSTPTRAGDGVVLCTRSPRCGLHERSLDELLGEPAPLALVVGSPLLCESRTCGPVLEDVLSIVPAHRARIRFAHVEPYAELNTISLAPIMRRWGLPSEPWVLLFDAAGVVRARFEGPVNATEVEAALSSL